MPVRQATSSRTFKAEVRSKYSNASSSKFQRKRFGYQRLSFYLLALKQLESGGKDAATGTEQGYFVHHQFGCVEIRLAMKGGFHHHRPAGLD